MIWASTKKVAFGVKSPWVVAWYCPAGNDPAVGETGSPAAYKANVKKTCIEKGMNVCYNDKALVAHNAKRLLHQDTEPLELDAKAAAAIQSAMDAPDFDGVMPAPADRGNADFLDCAESIFTEDDDAKISEVAGSDVATKAWYDQGNALIDYATGRPRLPRANTAA